MIVPRTIISEMRKHNGMDPNLIENNERFILCLFSASFHIFIIDFARRLIRPCGNHRMEQIPSENSWCQYKKGIIYESHNLAPVRFRPRPPSRKSGVRVFDHSHGPQHRRRKFVWRCVDPHRFFKLRLARLVDMRFHPNGTPFNRVGFSRFLAHLFPSCVKWTAARMSPDVSSRGLKLSVYGLPGCRGYPIAPSAVPCVPCLDR